MTQTIDIWNVIEPYLADEKLELDDLELSGHGRGRTLRIVVDGEDLDLERLAELSRGIARLLDDEPSLQDQYQLEVTSPGLERKLRRRRHYEKSVGREVVVKANGEEQAATYRGVLVDVDDTGFTIEADNGQIDVSFDTVVTAKTVFRWEKAPKPGH